MGVGSRVLQKDTYGMQRPSGLTIATLEKALLHGNVIAAQRG